MAAIDVALCITDLDVGGAERCLVELATRLDRAAFRPAVYCLGPRPRRPEASCLPSLEDARVAVHCLDGRRYRQAPGLVRRLRRLWLARKPRVVQTFLFHANIVGRLAARSAGVSAVASGIRVAERRRWHLRLDRATDRWVDRHVCVSRAVAEFSRRRARLPAEKLTVIPNGIDVARYDTVEPADRHRLGVPAGGRLVSCVGRLHEQKGLAWLLQTASHWLTAGTDCRLLIVGEGPLRRRLEALARRLKIADRVHFTGWRADVAEILAASDLLVLPSQWEGMPNVVLQAMASRLPVLATDVEGVREILGELAPPQTVAYGDTAAWTERLVGLLADRPRARDLGQQNRRRVAGEFAVQTMVDRYQSLWQSLVDG